MPVWLVNLASIAFGGAGYAMATLIVTPLALA
jgi:hypothetical protein